MNFTVIDFETANSQRASACALGVVKVVDGEIVSKEAWLIRPYNMKFDGMNIGIHGILPEHVKNEPEFGKLYQEIFKERLKDELIVAHNASFDMSVLRKSLEHYGLTFPSLNYLCTVKVAQKTWPDLKNHKLDTVARFLNFKFKHHDALDDCLACANLLIEACNKEGVSNPLAIAKKHNIKIGQVFPGGYKPCSSTRK